MLNCGFMIPAVKALIVGIIVVSVAVPSAYFAYNYSISSPTEVTHYIPNNSSAVIHLVNNTSDYYIFEGTGYDGIILNYSFSSFTNKAQSVSNSTSISSTSPSKGNSSVTIKFYEAFLGSDIYKVNISNVSISSLITPGLPNISFSKIIPLNKSITMYASPIGDSYVIIGNLNATLYSISTNHFGTYWKTSHSLIMKNYAYVSFYLNISSILLNHNLTRLKNNVTLTTNQSYISEVGNPSLFVVYGNATNNITNVTIQISNTTLLHDLISVIESKYGSYVISMSNPNPNKAIFEFNIGIKDLGNKKFLKGF